VPAPRSPAAYRDPGPQVLPALDPGLYGLSGTYGPPADRAESVATIGSALGGGARCGCLDDLPRRAEGSSAPALLGQPRVQQTDRRLGMWWRLRDRLA
jgi:hypothetical protein